MIVLGLRAMFGFDGVVVQRIPHPSHLAPALSGGCKRFGPLPEQMKRAGLLIRSFFLRAANGKGISSLQTGKTDCD